MLFDKTQYRQTCLLSDMGRLPKWFSLVLFSATLLFGCKEGEYAVKIFADKSLVGAEVLIDGEKAGVLDGRESAGAYYSKWLPAGPHRIQVRTGTKVVYEETISPKAGASEHYVQVQVKP